MAVAAMTISGFTASAQNTKTDTDCCAPAPTRPKTAASLKIAQKRASARLTDSTSPTHKKINSKNCTRLKLPNARNANRQNRAAAAPCAPNTLPQSKPYSLPNSMSAIWKTLPYLATDHGKNRASTTVQCAPPALRLQTQHAPRLPHPNNQNDLIPI